MRPSIILLSFLLSSCFSFGQSSNDTTTFRTLADKIIIAFWGQNNFNKYIHFENNYEKSITESVDSFTKSSFKPEFFKFKYFALHPAFHGDTARIEFELDSIGKLQLGLLPQGLYQVGNLDSLKLLNQNKAVALAKTHHYLSRVKNIQRITLEWHSTEPDSMDSRLDSILARCATGQYKAPRQSYTNGVYAWAIHSTLKKEYWYNGMYFSENVCYINSITGKWLGTSEY